MHGAHREARITISRAGRVAGSRPVPGRPAGAADARCRPTRSTRHRRRRRRWRRGRRGAGTGGRACRGRRSTRRSGLRRVSVRGRAAPSASIGRPSLVSATIGCRAPYSAGRMSSVIPASMTTWRPPRSRTWRTRATSQPARATRARPGSIARRPGRRSSGTASSSAGSSRAKRLGLGADLVERQDREPAADVERVERRAARRRAAPRRPARAGPRRATRPRRRAASPTCRWTPRGRTAPSAFEVIHSTSPVASVSVIPNFDAPSPTASPAMVSGVTSGLSRTRTSSAGRSPRPSPARRAIRVTTSASSANSRATHRSGRAGRRCPDRRPQVRVGLADALERDPIVRDPGPTCDRPLAARDDVGAEPAGGDLGDDRPGRRWP